jgi:GT2 family glycosyltransferase
MSKVTIVTAYNNKVELTHQFLDNMKHFKMGSDVESKIILVNGGNSTKIEHDAIWKRIDLPINIGFCNTLNAGLKEIPEDTDYVFFVGNDSFPVNDGWLSDLIELQKRTGAWMVCPANDNPGMNAYTHLYDKDCGDYYEVQFFPSIAWLMPYDKFKEIGLLDERYIRTGMYADNDYCIRIIKSSGTIVVSKHILLKHLCSAEGRVLGTVNADMGYNLNLFKEKWGL